MRWEGTLEEYVHLIQSGEFEPLSTHQRLYYAVKRAIDQRKDDPKLIAMHNVIKSLFKYYLTPANQGYDIKKRMVIFVGPPGSGKSTLVQFLKQALIDFSKTAEGAVIRIKGCPLQENPLLALPPKWRIYLREECQLEVKGELSPLNKYKLDKEYQGDWRQIPVERFVLSESERRGIGSFFPGDPHTQELSELVGGVDFSTITTYGSTSDPRAYRYDGELQAANQGILELHEVFKCRTELLYPLLTLAEEGTYKITRQSMIHTDLVMFGHTNEEDLRNFISQGNNHALLSRMVLINVPHNLLLDAEVNLYKQIIPPNEQPRLMYQALETLAAAVIMTRLKKSNTYPITLSEKIDVYNKKNSSNLIKDDLQAEHPDEGMFGLESRLVFNAISSVLATESDQIDAKMLLDELLEWIEDSYRFTESEKQAYQYCIRRARARYIDQLLKHVEDYFAERNINQLNEMVQRFLCSEEGFQEFSDVLEFDRAMYDQLQENISELDVNKIDFSILPTEYQRRFKQKLRQDCVDHLKKMDQLKAWLTDEFWPYMVYKDRKFSMTSITDLYEILR
ncbi:hypothetical protein [Alkalibacillus aidingensis]|uniref:hypothetical protein n=1 Tax=Alkalibacillus aidingensis TaxID=2747607 RepID=UPI001660BE0D|nr:hypothetical protein [Alkalibacillus aidingensis]